jgi:hypothetical protein
VRLHGRNYDTRGLEERQHRPQDDGARKKAKAAGLPFTPFRVKRRGATKATAKAKAKSQKQKAALRRTDWVGVDLKVNGP